MNPSSLIDIASSQLVDWVTTNTLRAAEKLPQDIIENIIQLAPQEKKENKLFYARINLLPTAEIKVPCWRIDSVALKALRFIDVQKLDIINTLSFNEGLITVSKCCPQLRSLRTNFYPEGLNALFQRCLFLTELTLTGSQTKYPLINFVENKLESLAVKVTNSWVVTENQQLVELLRVSPSLHTLTVKWTDSCDIELVDMDLIDQLTHLKSIEFLNANVSCINFKYLLNSCRNIECLTMTSGRTATSTVTQICHFGGQIKKLHLEGLADRHDLNDFELEALVNQQYQLLRAAVPGIEVTLNFKVRESHHNLMMTNELL